MKQRATLTRRCPLGLKDGKWVYRTESFRVQVIAVVGFYAMVRRDHCMPFVCYKKSLTEFDDQKRKKARKAK